MTAVAWQAVGAEDGPVVVFIHGTRVARGSWLAVATRLADRFRCVSVDLPGHGVLREEHFTLDAAVAVVRAAIEGSGGAPVVLVGLSLGGYVAMEAAAHDPDRVRGLVLAGASAEPSGRVAAMFRLYGWALSVLPQRPLDALNTWLFRRRYPPEVVEPIVADGYSSRGGAEAVRVLAQTRFRERLLDYGGPILVINGDLDVVFRLGARSFLRGVPNVTRRVLRWTSHLSPMDRPDAVAAAIRRFVEQLPA